MLKRNNIKYFEKYEIFLILLIYQPFGYDKKQNPTQNYCLQCCQLDFALIVTKNPLICDVCKENEWRNKQVNF